MKHTHTVETIKSTTQSSNKTDKTLRWAIGATLAVLSIELIGGYLSGSLALLTDSIHMFTDGFALFLVWFALRFAQQLPTKTKTYGLHRYEVLVTLLNGIFLAGIAISIIYEAYQRIQTPRAINVPTLMVTAGIGLITNCVILFKLNPHRNASIKSAWWHVLSDSLSSVAVVVSGIIVYFTGIFLVDSILSIVLAGVIMIGAVSLMREAVQILLQYTPTGIDLDKMILALKKIRGVKDLHHIHIWTLCHEVNVLSAHVITTTQNLKRTTQLAEKIDRTLVKYNIKHTTLQFECEQCSHKTTGTKKTLLRHVKH